MAKCVKCGNEVAEGTLFCTKCGTPVAAAKEPVAEEPTPIAVPEEPAAEESAPVPATEESASAAAPLVKQSAPAKDPYDYDMTGDEEPEPILGSYEIPKEVLEAKPKKSIPWALIGIALGAVAIIAIIAVLATKIIGGMGSKDKDAAGEGTALADMLDKAGDEVADIYSIDVSKLDSKSDDNQEDEGIIWEEDEDDDDVDEEEDEDDIEPAEEASADGHVVEDVDTKALAGKFSGDTESKSNDKFSVDVPDTLLGSVSGESDSTRSGSFADTKNGHGGKMTILVKFGSTYDENDVENELDYLRENNGAEDISELKLKDVTLYGVEYDDEHLDGSKFAKRQYYGVHNGDLINFFIDSKDSSTDVFNDPSTWALIYSLGLN